MSEQRPWIRHLFSVVAGLLLIGIVLVLPDLSTAIRSTDVVQAYRGEIVTIATQPAGNDPNLPPIPMAKVKMLEGPQAGQTVDALMTGPGGSQTVADYKPGEDVVVTITDDQNGGKVISVSDRWRLPALEILVILFAAAVVARGPVCHRDHDSHDPLDRRLEPLERGGHPRDDWVGRHHRPHGSRGDRGHGLLVYLG